MNYWMAVHGNPLLTKSLLTNLPNEPISFHFQFSFSVSHFWGPYQCCWRRINSFDREICAWIHNTVEAEVGTTPTSGCYRWSLIRVTVECGCWCYFSLSLFLPYLLVNAFLEASVGTRKIQLRWLLNRAGNLQALILQRLHFQLIVSSIKLMWREPSHRT